MSKTYQLMATKPLSEFDNAMMRMLNEFADAGVQPRAAVVVALTDTGEVATYYHDATMQDMILAKGFIDLDIQSDNVLGNLPFYTRQARKEGLLDEEDEEYEGEDL